MEQLKETWHKHIANNAQEQEIIIECNATKNNAINNNDIKRENENDEIETRHRDIMLQQAQEKEKLQKIYNNEIRGQIALYITKIHIFPKHILEKNLLFIQELIHEAQTMQIQIDSNLIESIKELQQALQFSQDCNAYKKVNTISNSRLCKYGQNASFFSKF